jgi:hypothetical protein
VTRLVFSPHPTPPSFPPPQPIDINELRADRGGNPDFWRENQRRRFQDPALVDQVLALDEVCVHHVSCVVIAL